MYSANGHWEVETVPASLAGASADPVSCSAAEKPDLGPRNGGTCIGAFTRESGRAAALAPAPLTGRAMRWAVSIYRALFRAEGGKVLPTFSLAAGQGATLWVGLTPRSGEGPKFPQRRARRENRGKPEARTSFQIGTYDVSR